MASYCNRIMLFLAAVWLTVMYGFEMPKNFKSNSKFALSLGGKKLDPPIGFISPDPRPFTVADGDYGGFLKGAAATVSRFGSGAFVVGWTPVTPEKERGSWPGTLNILRDTSTLLPFCARPAKPLVLYEYEASPFCRKVREAMSMLDLTVEYRPCPGARQGWSEVMTRSTQGKRTVPYLVDNNANVAMFESDDIIKYLFNTYGPGEEYIPWTLKGKLAVDTATISSAIRGNAGSRVLPNVRKDIQSLKPVTLWGYEGSPFVRVVREMLNSLGLQHVMIHCARGSANRDKLYEKTGRFQVPYLEDPNTGVDMFESADIAKYLLATYTD